MPYTPNIPHLQRAHAALGDLIVALEKGKADEYDWLAFYDAASFVDGLEDAAAECAANHRVELGLGEDGWPLDDMGYPMPDDGWGFHHHRFVAPLTAIPAEKVA